MRPGSDHLGTSQRIRNGISSSKKSWRRSAFVKNGYSRVRPSRTRSSWIFRNLKSLKIASLVLIHKRKYSYQICLNYFDFVAWTKNTNSFLMQKIIVAPLKTCWMRLSTLEMPPLLLPPPPSPLLPHLPRKKCTKDWVPSTTLSTPFMQREIRHFPLP